jgi:hypothetical protein
LQHRLPFIWAKNENLYTLRHISSSISCQLFCFFLHVFWSLDKLSCSRSFHECLLFEIQLKCIFGTPLLCSLVHEYITMGYSTFSSLWLVVYHFSCCVYYQLHCFVHCFATEHGELNIAFRKRANFRSIRYIIPWLCVCLCVLNEYIWSEKLQKFHTFGLQSPSRLLR